MDRIVALSHQFAEPPVAGAVTQQSLLVDKVGHPIALSLPSLLLQRLLCGRQS